MFPEKREGNFTCGDVINKLGFDWLDGFNDDGEFN